MEFILEPLYKILAQVCDGSFSLPHLQAGTAGAEHWGLAGGSGLFHSTVGSALGGLGGVE